MANELIVKLFEHVDFGGQYRYLYKDTPSFLNEGFNDIVSSIIVYKGPSYKQGDVVRFYEHVNYGGGCIELGPGYYRNIHAQPYEFGDTISSADFLPAVYQPIFSPIYLIVTVYEHVNYGGQSRTFLLDETNFNNVGFNDTVSSIIVDAGPNWNNHVVNFYEHANYGGGILQPGSFRPGTKIPDLTTSPYQFNDRISSLKISKI